MLLLRGKSTYPGCSDFRSHLNPGRGKLTGVKGLVERRIEAQPDLTIDELTAELRPCIRRLVAADVLRAMMKFRVG
ncbi:hypothetical protein [Nioella ostreopsis]|uniref:hypothetical protein n=1 Tax=Nioella ostreopsis TaxID=2448479 RepID=UPI000FDA83DB|nr:hypothetical protein [Nioella ostreopsis]